MLSPNIQQYWQLNFKLLSFFLPGNQHRSKTTVHKALLRRAQITRWPHLLAEWSLPTRGCASGDGDQKHIFPFHSEDRRFRAGRVYLFGAPGRQEAFSRLSRPLQRAVSLTDRAHCTAYDDQKRTTMPATARDNDSLASQMYKNLFGVSFLLLRIPHSDLEIAPISSLPCQGKITRKAAVPAVRQCWVLARRPLTSRSSTDPAWGWATTGGVKWPPRHSPGPTKEHAAGTSESQCFLGSTSCCLVQRLPMWFLCFPSPFAFDGKSFL